MSAWMSPAATSAACWAWAGIAGHRAGVRRQWATRSGLPRDRVGHRVVHDLAEWVAVAVEDLQCLVDVVGKEEPRHRSDGIGAAELVDVRLGSRGRVGRDVGRRVDEAEQPASTVLDTGGQPHRCRLAWQLEGLGRGHRVHAEVEGAAECVDDAQPLDRQLSPEEGRGQPRRRRHGGLPGGAALPDDEPVVGNAEKLFAQTVERGRHQIERPYEVAERLQRRLIGVRQLGGAGQVSGILLVEPQLDGLLDGLPDARRDRAATDECPGQVVR